MAPRRYGKCALRIRSGSAGSGSWTTLPAASKLDAPGADENPEGVREATAYDHNGKDTHKMAKDTPSTAVAVRTSTDLAQINELEAILLANDADALPEVADDPEAMSREIIAQLLAAESDEELESFGAAIGWRSILGEPVQIKGFSWRPSDFDEGSIVYFVVRVLRVNPDTGELEPAVLTTGSRFVLAQLTNMAKRGTLIDSWRECVESERKTRGGFNPLRLRTPERIPGSGQAAA